MLLLINHVSRVQLHVTLWRQPARLFCPWDSPGKGTRVGCHAFLQGIFQTQESNLGLLHCRQILYQLSYEGSPERAESKLTFLVWQFKHLRQPLVAAILHNDGTSFYCPCCQVASVVSDSVRPHRQQPTRLPHPWDSPGKNTGVGIYVLVRNTCFSLSDLLLSV